MYKTLNFQKFSGASNKIATAGLPRGPEPWKFLRICQKDINWNSQKHSPHQFILSEIFQNVWVWVKKIKILSVGANFVKAYLSLAIMDYSYYFWDVGISEVCF